MKEIYYTEDDGEIARCVKEYLGERGFLVQIFPNSILTRQALRGKQPEAILIDWNLPDGQGDELCRWIRQNFPCLPIIFLTVRGETRDVVSGFAQGADDYVTKPFELEVLHSRIQALLRRAGKTGETKLHCGALTLDQEAMAVFWGQEELRLSQAEYGVLLILMKNKGRTVTRKQLLEQVWDREGNYVNDNTLTVTLKRLREKLPDASCLKTIRSFGYRMEEDV